MGFGLNTLKRIGGKALPVATGFLTGGPVGAVVGGLSLLQGQKQDKRATKLQDQAMAMQQARDAELAPIRQAGIRRLMDAQRPDLSGDFQSANPFARPLRRIG